MAEQMDTYDVIVAGGGTAGVIAAIAAARAGSRTLLIEKTGILGGTITTGAIAAPASFSAWHTQVIAGIGWELCCRTLKETGEIPPDPVTAEFPGRSSGRLDMRVNPALYAAVADEMIRESGATVLFHTIPAGVRYADHRWHVTVCTKTGLRDMTAVALVDCTGDANLVSLAGFEMDQDPDPQPGTLYARLAGYDAEAVDYEALQRAFDAEVAAGRLKRSDPGWGHGQAAFFFRSYGGNRIHVHGTDVHTSEGKSANEMEARRILLNLVRFGRRQPGMENLTVSYCATECGIRETVKIKGKKYITINDYETGRLWDDAVCYSFYPVDVHRSDHVDYREIPEHVHPTIPLGALLPAGSSRLIVAGRTASGDKEAHSAYRVESSCMAMGHAAGAAAALVARTGRDFTDLALPELYALLEKEGAIVPGKING